MFSILNLGLQRGSKALLENTSLQVNTGEKVGVLGNNGVGKSSLFGLLKGELEPSSGSLSIPNGLRISSVSQELHPSNQKALDFVIDGHQHFRAIEKRLHLAEKNNQGEQIAQCHHQLEDIHAYTIPATASKLLSGLGFKQNQFLEPVNQFSGGWQMRLNLAQALMCPADMLLLDEPTNHLDLDAIFFLEDWLKSFPGTLLIISHDARFLDTITTHIVHFNNLKLKKYSGNYQSFLVQQSEQLALQNASLQKQLRKKQHLESFISRFKAKATKAKQAQSRVKALQKMEFVSIARVNSPIQFSFAQPEQLPNPLLYIEDAKIGYENFNFNNFNIKLNVSDKIGFIGRNGSGKSTIVKTIAQQLPLLSGNAHFSKNIRIGYFSQQHVDTLRLNESPLWHLQKQSPQMTEQQSRTFLGKFGFNGDTVFHEVNLLSGGEKAKLSLALIIYEKPNLLILDEPTNHLDLDTREALEEALQLFVGALIIVSHDRSLLETCCDQLLLVNDGIVIPFDGSLEDYKKWLQINSNIKTSTKIINKKTKKQEDALFRNKLTPFIKKLKAIESQLDSLQMNIDKINLELSKPEIYQKENQQKLSAFLNDKHQLTSEFDSHENEWFVVSSQIDKIEKERDHDPL